MAEDAAGSTDGEQSRAAVRGEAQAVMAWGLLGIGMPAWVLKGMRRRVLEEFDGGAGRGCGCGVDGDARRRGLEVLV